MNATLQVQTNGDPSGGLYAVRISFLVCCVSWVVVLILFSVVRRYPIFCRCYL
jgi:hypothetical protein